MRKLKLEDLEVTSFAVSPESEKALGTIQANESTDPYEDSQDTFCPTDPKYGGCGTGPQTNGPDSCRLSCFNYTCEGATCRYVFC